MKRCPGCKTDKDEAAYSKNRAHSDGLQTQCKPCMRQSIVNSRAKSPEAYRETDRLYRDATKDRRKVTKDAWRAANPAKHAAHNRADRMRHPERVKARMATRVLARPDRCSRCNKVHEVHAHHPDYAKPLDIVWLCPPCHTNEHIME